MYLVRMNLIAVKFWLTPRELGTGSIYVSYNVINIKNNVFKLAVVNSLECICLSCRSAEHSTTIPYIV